MTTFGEMYAGRSTMNEACWLTSGCNVTPQEPVNAIRQIRN